MKNAILLCAGTFRAFLASVVLLPVTAVRAQFHVSTADCQVSGPVAACCAHVGDRVNISAYVLNLDECMDSLTVNEVFFTVHHGTGDVSFANFASGGVNVPNFDAAYFSTNFQVLPGDGDYVSISCRMRWTDNRDGLCGGVPQSPTYSSEPGIFILKPAMEVVQEVRPGPLSLIAYEGYVTNNGNTPLYDVEVKSDSGTPGDTADDTNRLIAILAPGTAVPIAGTYRDLGSSNTVTVLGKDVMGLVVSNSVVRGLSPKLSIARSGPGSVRISWPRWAAGYRLESSTDLGMSWEASSDTPLPGEADVFITRPVGSTTNLFFRLFRP